MRGILAALAAVTAVGGMAAALSMPSDGRDAGVAPSAPAAARPSAADSPTAPPRLTYGFLPDGWKRISANDGDSGRIVDVFGPKTMAERHASGDLSMPVVTVTVKPAGTNAATLYTSTVASGTRVYGAVPAGTDPQGRPFASITWAATPGWTVVVSGTYTAQDVLVRVADGLSVS